MFREPEDNILTFGWPWHGRVVLSGTGSAGTRVVELPGGLVRSFPAFAAIEPNSKTTVFDKGMPDIPDEELAKLGGAWLGRAILRGEDFTYCDAGFEPDGSGGYVSSRLPGTPLWWDGDEPDALPVFINISFGGSTLSAHWEIAGQQMSYSRSITPAELGQGTGQPRCAVPDMVISDWRELPENQSGFVFGPPLGCYRNRVLFGVNLRLNTGGLVPLPPTTVAGSSPNGPPAPLYGLVEVIVDASVRDPNADHSLAFSLVVIEDRASALGRPIRTTSDVQNPEAGTRTYSDQWVQTSGLLTAWYDSNGVMRTARFSREQTSTLDSVEDGLDYNWSLSRSTKLQLLFGGVVDERELTENLNISALDGTLDIERRVIETDRPDDVSKYHGPQYAVTYKIQPDQIYLPGLHLVMGAVARLVEVSFLGNVLEKQDIRQLWLAAHANNVASICSFREPFDYADGANSMVVKAYSGPVVGPLGLAGGAVSYDFNRPKTSSATRYYRGGFSDFGRPWLYGAGNPITGQVARAVDYYSGSITAITWV